MSKWEFFNDGQNHFLRGYGIKVMNGAEIFTFWMMILTNIGSIRKTLSGSVLQNCYQVTRLEMWFMWSKLNHTYILEYRLIHINNGEQMNILKCYFRTLEQNSLLPRVLSNMIVVCHYVATVWDRKKILRGHLEYSKNNEIM